MPRAIGVFSSSSDAVAPHYTELATALGALLARRGLTLFYGGGRVGLMGALARAVHAGGGRVIGVLPGFLRTKKVAYEEADELIITAALRERKAIMEARADAFVALPVVFLNTRGFFDPLLALFEQLYREQFTREHFRDHYHVAAAPAHALDHIENYQPPAPAAMWFEKKSNV